MVMLAALGTIFALQVLAIQETKDNVIPDEVHGDPVLLAAGSQRPVQTAALRTHLDLTNGFEDLLGLPASLLRKLRSITIPRERDPNNVTHYVQIGGFSKRSHEQVTLYAVAPAGLQISVDVDGIHAYLPYQAQWDSFEFGPQNQDVDDDEGGNRTGGAFFLRRSRSYRDTLSSNAPRPTDGSSFREVQ